MYVGDGGTLIINNNNKALCFVRMRWDETSATKCSEDGKLSADDFACFAQPTGTILEGRHKGCNYRGGKPPHKSYQMKPAGPTKWRLQVHFRGILTIGITGIIIRVMIMMMPVVEMAEWWRFSSRFCDLVCGAVPGC